MRDFYAISMNYLHPCNEKLTKPTTINVISMNYLQINYLYELVYLEKANDNGFLSQSQQEFLCYLYELSLDRINYLLVISYT